MITRIASCTFWFVSILIFKLLSGGGVLTKSGDLLPLPDAPINSFADLDARIKVWIMTPFAKSVAVIVIILVIILAVGM